MQIVQESLACLPELSKPRRKFMLELFSLLLSLRGRANYRNLSRYSDYEEKTFQRNARKPFPFQALNLKLAEQTLSDTCVLVGDASFISKSGTKTYGLASFWNGSAKRSERGLELSVLALVDKYRQAMALSVSQTPSEIHASSRIDFYLQQVQESQPYWPKGMQYAIFDGYYSKQTFVNGIGALGLDMIGKLRKDANLRYLYRGSRRRVGRPKIFDGKVFYDDVDRWDKLGELEPGIHGFVQNLWHISLERVVRVVMLLNAKDREKQTHILLFSTDLNLSAEQIIAHYGSRFSIEFLFRDAKQHLGLGHCQARNKEALNFHFNACMSALNLAKVNALKGIENNEGFVFSMHSQKCLFFNEHLLERFISKFALNRTLIKSSPEYENLRNYGVIAS
jgi:hypothetical protein